MSVERRRRNGEITKVRPRAGVMFIMVIEDGLHYDRFKCASQRGSRQSSCGRRHAEFSDRQRGGIP
jgi:hypothetical protein